MSFSFMKYNITQYCPPSTSTQVKPLPLFYRSQKPVLQQPNSEFKLELGNSITTCSKPFTFEIGSQRKPTNKSRDHAGQVTPPKWEIGLPEAGLANYSLIYFHKDRYPFCSPSYMFTKIFITSTVKCYNNEVYLYINNQEPAV